MKKTKIYSILALVSLLTMIMAMAAIVPAKAPPMTSLVGQWDFDEGAGKIAYDSSGNSNHGTLSGGKFGGCLEFDGTNDYLIVPDSAELDVTGPITIEAWIKPYSLPYGVDSAGDAVIISKYNQYATEPGQRSYRLHIRNGLLSFYLSSDGTNYVDASAGDIAGYIGEWVHVAFTFDGVNCNLYINGIAQSVSVTTSSIFASASPLYMGAYLPNDLRPFEGLIDEVRICDVAMTTFDLDNPPDDTDAVGLWHFDEETGQTAADSAGINDAAQLGSTSGTDVNDPIWISSGPTWVPRDTGYALCFDGVDDVVYIDNEENFDFNYDDAFSIEALFQTESNEELIIVSKCIHGLGFPERGFQLIKHDSSHGNALYFFLVNTYLSTSSGNQIRCFGSTDVADGEWHHVIVTYDGSESVSGVNIYLDGVPETIGSTIGTVSADTTNDLPVQISGRDGTNYVFNGCIDEVKIWSAELQPPIADANGPYIWNEGSAISLDGSGSSDADGTIVLYEWDLDNDGQYDDATGVTTTNTWFDDYSGFVGLKVTDDNGFIDTDSTTVTVNNVAPDVDAGADDTINEGDTFTRGGSFTDPGADSWTAWVDYGEGAGEESLALSGKTFSLSNLYEEDGIYTVTVKVQDDDSGEGIDTLTVTVNNVAPTIDSLTGDIINENGVATVSGTFSDPGTMDTFTVTIDWGEGSPQDYSYPAGSTSFIETHQYLDDNPTATASDVYSVSVTVTDDDTGSDSDSTSVTVNNVAPTIDSATGDTINEGGIATVSGTFSDIGTLDTFTIDIDWDDGSTDTYSYGVASTIFSHTHPYTLTGAYDVSVTVIDDDTGEDSDTVRVVVLPYSDLTNSGLCPSFDREPETEGDQFRLIFTPDLNGNPNQYKISTTNPGQFYYNIFHVGEVSPDDPFTISIPYPFATQGANPVHVYDGADINEYGCYMPGTDITTNFEISPATSALYFDEGHDYLDFGDNFEFGKKDSFTAECWIKTNQNPQTDYGAGARVEIMGTYGITDPIHPSPDQFWALWLEDDGKASFWLRTDNSIANTAMVYSSTTVNDGKWHHIACVKDVKGSSKVIMIYVDGVLEQTAPCFDGETDNNLPFRIGDGHWSRWYHGYVDEVRISDTARYTSNFVPQGPFIDDGNTVALWHFDEGTGQSVSDATGVYNGFLGSTQDPDANDPSWRNIIVVSPLSSGSGVYYINVHLEYGLKQDGGYDRHLYEDEEGIWRSHADKNDAVAIWDLTDYTFSVSGPVSDTQTMQNRNEFKKIRGIAGMIEGVGEGVAVTISGECIPDNSVTVYTDEDGFYGYAFFHKGKRAKYTVDAGIYGKVYVEIKAGRFVEVNFP
jgi:hypothetical protein